MISGYFKVYPVNVYPKNIAGSWKVTWSSVEMANRMSYNSNTRSRMIPPFLLGLSVPNTPIELIVMESNLQQYKEEQSSLQYFVHCFRANHFSATFSPYSRDWCS